MADKEKLNNIGRVASVRRRDVETISIDNDYTLTFPDKSFLTETGHLIIFELKRESNGPDFQARWDDKRSAIDIDVVGVSKAQQRRFQKSEEGLDGHHSTDVSKDERKYHINIVYGAKKIFEGMVSINLDFELTARCDIRIGGSVQ
jgi:hypothetical protein